MNPCRLLCLIIFLFLVLLSKASRIHVESRRFAAETSGEDREFLPSQSTPPVIDAGEILPEKRKVKTGSNPLHNRR